MEKSRRSWWDGADTFLKRVTLLSVGQGMAQLLPVLATPFIARLYSPEALGELALYISASNIVTQLMALKYDYAITMAESQKKAQQLLCLSLGVSLGFSLLLIFLMPFYPIVMNKIGGNIWLYFLPLGSLFTITQISLVNYRIQREGYARVSGAAAVRSGIYCLLQLILYSLGTGGLILARFGGDLSAGWVLWKGRSPQKTAPKELLQTAREFKDYPRYMVPGAVAGAISGNVQSFFISACYSTSQTGGYSLVNRILGTPITVLSSAIGQVFLRQSINEMQTYGRVQSAWRMTMLLTVFSVCIFGGVWLSAPLLVTIFLGTGWQEAVGFLRIQALLFGVRFVAVPITLVVPALGKQKATMLWQFAMLGLCLIPPLAAIKIDLSVQGYLLLTAGMLSAGYLAFLGYCLWLCEKGQVKQDER